MVSNQIDSNSYILKVDSTGKKQWHHYLIAAHLNDVAVIPDSGFVFIGTLETRNPVNQTNLLLVRIDQEGNLLRQRQYPYEGHDTGLFVNYVDSLAPRSFQLPSSQKALQGFRRTLEGWRSTCCWEPFQKQCCLHSYSTFTTRSTCCLPSIIKRI